MYRYPFKSDSEEFIQRLCKFIENDLLNISYSLNKKYNTFYIGVEKGKIIFIDKNTFDDKEKKYIREQNDSCSESEDNTLHD